MDEITAIFDAANSASEIITHLKEKSVDVPLWKDLLVFYDPLEHEVVKDKNILKDKIRSDGEKEESSRIYIALEELLSTRMSEFTFAIPVKRVYHNTEDDKEKQEIANALEKIYKYARIDSENLKRGKKYFASCEVFTLWYAVKKKNTLYGFNSDYKLKCKTYSPMDGYELYPLFDEHDDMLAMSFQYSKTVDNKTVSYFETFTDDKHYKWTNCTGGWEIEDDPEEIKLLKIPGSYIWRQKPIYFPVVNIRKEIELTVSRNSNIIGYNVAPVLKIAGALRGNEEKGESRRVYRVEAGGDVSYVSWDQSIEALKYQVEILLRLAFMQAQLPDLSFDNMKNLGNIGFDARQTLLTDAHLKVGDEKGPIIEFLERECNVIKAFLKKMNTSYDEGKIDDIDVEHIITPFIQNDEKTDIENRQLANGGKAIESQLESIQKYGQSSDPAATLKQIQEEDKLSARNKSVMDVFNSAE